MSVQRFAASALASAALILWSSSACARYVESDPIGQAAGPSTYSYVSSTPLNAKDPYGLDLILVGGGGAAGNSFTLAAQTWNSQNGGNSVNQVVQIGSGQDAIAAMSAYASAHGGDIDGLEYFGHSGNYGLFPDPGTPQDGLYTDWYGDLVGAAGQQLDPRARRISQINKNWFRHTKRIKFWGCNTAKGPSSFAQQFAQYVGQPATGALGPTAFSGVNGGLPGQGLPPGFSQGPLYMVPQYANRGFTTFP